jgi:membrane protein implicated in regulation of membrane protease activity
MTSHGGPKGAFVTWFVWLGWATLALSSVMLLVSGWNLRRRDVNRNKQEEKKNG